jgi:hypothetical protein
MRGEPTPRRLPGQLYVLRLAWRAIQAVLERYDLSSIALKLNADDPSQACQNADGLVLFSEDFRGRWSAREALSVVRVDLGRARAQVIIARIDRLVRPKHLGEFDEVWLAAGSSGPDVDVEVDLAEVVALEGELLRTAPQRVLPERSRPRRTPRTLRAFGRHS